MPHARISSLVQEHTEEPGGLSTYVTSFMVIALLYLTLTCLWVSGFSHTEYQKQCPIMSNVYSSNKRKKIAPLNIQLTATHAALKA